MANVKKVRTKEPSVFEKLKQVLEPMELAQQAVEVSALIKDILEAAKWEVDARQIDSNEASQRLEEAFNNYHFINQEFESIIRINKER